jgi:hypothetical protein
MADGVLSIPPAPQDLSQLRKEYITILPSLTPAFKRDTGWLEPSQLQDKVYANEPWGEMSEAPSASIHWCQTLLGTGLQVRALDWGAVSGTKRELVFQLFSWQLMAV